MTRPTNYHHHFQWSASRTDAKFDFCRAAATVEPLEGRVLFSLYTVTTLGDFAGLVTPAGLGRYNATTLRAAINAANVHVGTDTINFAAGVTGKVDLKTALPDLADGLILSGPGASKLAVERSPAATTNFSIFSIGPGRTVAFSGMTIARGTGITDALGNRRGGGIHSLGTLSLSDCRITGNSAVGQRVTVDGNEYDVHAGDGKGGGIYSSGTLTLSRCTVSGNAARGGDNYPAIGGDASGGGIYSEGKLSLRQSTVSGNTAIGGTGGFYWYYSGGGTMSGKGYGGGISSAGTLTLTDCSLANNTAGGGTGDDQTADSCGGGIFANHPDDTTSLIRCTLKTNSAGTGGGGILNDGTLNLRQCTLTGNSATTEYGEGGGIASQGTLQLTDCTLSGNGAGRGGGGGISSKNDYDYDGNVLRASTLTMTRCTLSGNAAESGGGLYGDGTLLLTDCVISGNTATNGGGGISNNGALTATGCTLSGNSTRQYGGGGISNGGLLTANNCTLSENSSEFQDGGGISNGGTLIAVNCTFVGNSADAGGGDGGGGGGGIYNYSSCVATLNLCTLWGNSSSSYGGGIYNTGTLTMSNSNVSGNSSGMGGGLYNYGETAATNCTISGNSAGTGGGIFNNGDAGGILTLKQCTLYGNSAFTDGGLFSTSSVNFYNSIVAGNVKYVGLSTVASDLSAGSAEPSSSSNLIGTGGAGGLINVKNGNRVGVTLAQLKLAPLADNGGPTMTMALLPGSIAINAGSNAKAVGPDGKPLATDQRGTGYARIVGGKIDIGAFEVQPVGTVSGIVFKDLNGNRKQDPGETGLKGWLVFADLNRDGKLTAGEPQSVTDSAGNYKIPGLPAGKYLIRLQPQPGWKQTQPLGGGPNGPTVLAGLETRRWDFGIQPILGV